MYQKRNHMKIPALSLCIICFSSFASIAQDFDPALTTQLQHKIDSLRNTANLKGMSVCVLHPDFGIWKGTSGISYPGVPINSEMSFGIGSNTKLFTGVLILKLAENNLLQLDDSISSYLPPYNNIDPNITIRQLLNHTSGLDDVNNVTGYQDSILSDPNHLFNPPDVIGWIGPALYTPGNGWNYCNTNYLLAGLIAESITGQSYNQLLKDSILTPLQLDSTLLDVYEMNLLEVAHPWQNGVDNFAIPRRALNSVAWSAGAMYSTAGEMVAWYQALFNSGFLDTTSFIELTTFTGPAPYGIGLYSTNVLGRTVWQHGGTIWGGYNTSMVYDPATGIIISVLINQLPAQAFEIATQLLATILQHPASIEKEQPRNFLFTVHPNPANTFISIAAPGLDIETISIHNQEGKLLMQSVECTIPVSGFSPGIYVISAKSGRLVRRTRFIKN